MYVCFKLNICTVIFLKLSNRTTLARNMKKKTILVLMYLGAVSWPCMEYKIDISNFWTMNYFPAVLKLLKRQVNSTRNSSCCFHLTGTAPGWCGRGRGRRAIQRQRGRRQARRHSGTPWGTRTLLQGLGRENWWTTCSWKYDSKEVRELELLLRSIVEDDGEIWHFSSFIVCIEVCHTNVHLISLNHSNLKKACRDQISLNNIQYSTHNSTKVSIWLLCSPSSINRVDLHIQVVKSPIESNVDIGIHIGKHSPYDRKSSKSAAAGTKCRRKNLVR